MITAKNEVPSRLYRPRKKLMYRRVSQVTERSCCRVIEGTTVLSCHCLHLPLPFSLFPHAAVDEVWSIMKRRWKNESASFASSITSNSKELQAELKNQRAEMKDAWDALDRDWKELDKRMVSIGIIKSESLDNCVVHLNIGGSILNLRRAALKSLHQKTLASLFDVEWDSRIPRDKDGRIFLDESPLIVKLLHNVQLTAAKKVRACDSARYHHLLPADQLSYITNASKVYGLQNSLLVRQTKGVSAVLNDDEIGLLTVDMVRSFPGDTQCLELIYRASRHGLNASAFHERCTDENPSTITLIKVGDYVIGGFSSVPWTAAPKPNGLHYRDSPGLFHYYAHTRSPDAFIFLAKDCSAIGEGHCSLVKWALPLYYDGQHDDGQPSVRLGKKIGPDFGNGGFRVTFTSP